MEPLSKKQMESILDEVVDWTAYEDIGYYCRQMADNAEFLATTLAECTTQAKELGMIDDLKSIQDRYLDLEFLNQEYEERWR